MHYKVFFSPVRIQIKKGVVLPLKVYSQFFKEKDMQSESNPLFSIVGSITFFDRDGDSLHCLLKPGLHRHTS